MGSRIHSAVSHRNSGSKMFDAARQTSVAPCASTHLRYGGAASDAGHPKSLSVVGAQQPDHHGSLRSSRSHRKAGGHRSGRTAKLAQRQVPASRQTTRAAERQPLIVRRTRIPPPPLSPFLPPPLHSKHPPI